MTAMVTSPRAKQFQSLLKLLLAEKPWDTLTPESQFKKGTIMKFLRNKLLGFVANGYVFRFGGTNRKCTCPEAKKISIGDLLSMILAPSSSMVSTGLLFGVSMQNFSK